MIPQTMTILQAGFSLFILLGICGIANADPTNSAPGQANARKPAQLVEPAEAAKLIASNKVVILDVRTPAEFAQGHIAGATNLDFRAPDFQAKLEKLDKNQPYLVHCAAGGRSGRACKLMDRLEFKSVYDLKGGVMAWEKAGQPLEK